MSQTKKLQVKFNEVTVIGLSKFIYSSYLWCLNGIDFVVVGSCVKAICSLLLAIGHFAPCYPVFAGVKQAQSETNHSLIVNILKQVLFI